MAKTAKTKVAKRPGKKQASAHTGRKQGSPKKTRMILAAIVLAALVPRIAYLAELRVAPEFELPYIDAAYHDIWARGIAFDDWRAPPGMADPEIRTTPYFRPPGYPYFLAAIYKLTQGSFLAPRLVQMAFGLLNVLLAFLLGRRLFGRTEGLVFAGLMSCYWGFIYFEGELLAPVLLVTLGLALTYALLAWQRNFSPAWATAAGLALGLFALFRANILLFAPIALLWAGWGHLRGPARKSFLISAIVFTGAVILVIAPVTWRNYRVSGDPVLVTSNAGINLYIGNNPQSDGLSAVFPVLKSLTGRNNWTSFDYPAVVAGVQRLEGRAMTDSQVSKYFSGKAVDYILEEPGTFLRSCLKKTALFWGPAEISNNKVLHYERFYSPVLRYLPRFSLAAALGLFGILSLLAQYRKGGWVAAAPTPPHPRAAILPLLLIGVYFVSFLPFFVTGRFRLPVVAFLLLYGARGISLLIATITQRGKSFWMGPTLLGACLLLALIPWVDYQPDQALWHYHRGISWDTRGTPEKAMEAYQECLRLDSGAYEAHNKIGIIHYRRGQIGDAVRQWQHSIEKNPEQKSILNNLAWIMATSGSDVLRQPEAALTYALKACQLTEYDQAGPLDTLAAAYAAADRFEEAVEYAERGLKLARERGLDGLIKKLESHLTYYKNGRAYVE